MLRERLVAVFAALGVVMMGAGFVVMGSAGSASATGSDPENMTWVCKYVGNADDGFEPTHGGEPVQVPESWLDGRGSSFSDEDPWIVVEEGATCPQPPPRSVPPDEPIVYQSQECEEEGTFVIPGTYHVTYLLDGDPIAAGTYPGPRTGTITAVADEGYVLTAPLSFQLNLAAAAECEQPEKPQPIVDKTVEESVNCATDVVTITTTTTTTDWVWVNGQWTKAEPVVTTTTTTRPATVQECPPEATAVAPTVAQSQACEVEGSYTVPSTPGVQYLLDDEPIEAGTFTGPAEGVITAVGIEGTVLTNPEFSFTLDLPAAAECDEVLPSEAADVCPNIGGVQAAIPAGHSLVQGVCVADEIAGTETAAPNPETGAPNPEAVPTAVDAGLAGPVATGTAPGGLLGQGLLAGGLMLLLLAGWLRFGHLDRGAHQV